MRPIIGITTHAPNDQVVQDALYNRHYTSPALYVDAVRRAGGVPVLLPPDVSDVTEWLELADGFVVSGGTDIDPTLYGGDPGHPSLFPASPKRDQSELDLTRALLEQRNKPALFVCRGMQMMNVALGGTLHEDIKSALGQDIHRGADGLWTQQEVQVEEASNLYRVMQAQAPAPYSGHHQGIKDVAEGLVVSASAADGIVEALEVPDHPYLIGVQWHPEMSADREACQQRLFDGLIAGTQ
ncbi:gamma-glutamyl-gamma-aminobutyrate hydrolase family protein [Roseovarius sp. EL26]|uniref:gamma-glutamyl-gamma-aminobutyrate hydrolase family protein n=1 Tax=Roseovarius sp. EL26 TaxID=2126672 RepID=UPI000EA34FC8|nr:gamma-glutamyl-gamma-aminobutyrate hydrolase family protein [Roseovarius sp. EL26]